MTSKPRTASGTQPARSRLRRVPRFASARPAKASPGALGVRFYPLPVRRRPVPTVPARPRSSNASQASVYLFNAGISASEQVEAQACAVPAP